MEQYWNQYHQVKGSVSTGESITISTTDDSTSGYWVEPWTTPYPWDYPPITTIYWQYPPVYESKKEGAYEILKVLVKEEVIKEPKSFKKFCNLIEKIAKVI